MAVVNEPWKMLKLKAYLLCITSFNSKKGMYDAYDDRRKKDKKHATG